MNHEQQQAIKEIVKDKIRANRRDSHYTEYAIMQCVWEIVDPHPNTTVENLATRVLVDLLSAPVANEILTLMEGAQMFLPPQDQKDPVTTNEWGKI